MVDAFIFLSILGAILAGMLGAAAIVFYVYEDPRIAEVEGVLPGANCGGCGYAGCSAFAGAIVAGESSPAGCVAGGPGVTQTVAEVMGMKVAAVEPKLAFQTCNGGARAETKFNYLGIHDCRALALLYKGDKKCEVACLGMGTCVRNCPFGALTMGENGLPIVDLELCTGCGNCEKVCPTGAMKVQNSTDKSFHFNMFDDRLAPCQQTCPAEIDIPRYIDHIKNGRYEEAVLTIKEKNPFLLTCGRVCPHPCEEVCRRALGDDPVSINQLKRFVADYEMNSGKHLPISVAPDNGRKIAIIGGGPGGLTCAYYLRRLGYSVTVFEMQPKLGGMLYYGIPEYRLPKKILDWEIQGILNLGIDARVNMKFGVDFDLESLVAAGYEAVFMAIGAWKYSPARLDKEEEVAGVEGATVFLERQGLGVPNPVGNKVGVIGGGNTAMDCVRTSLRLGAEKVYLIYRRSEKEMPANPEEIEAAHDEGIEFVLLSAPHRIVEEDGKLTNLEYLRMELGEPDESGRRRPVPLEGSETLIPLDNLILAIGQYSDLSFLDTNRRIKDIEKTKWNSIVTDSETNQTAIPYVFGGGDAGFEGPGILVGAVGDARKAARAIHLYLTGEDMDFPDGRLKLKDTIPGTIFDSISGIEKKGRIKLSQIDPKTRIHTVEEVDLTITEEEALKEANRCMNCCLTCYDKDIKEAS
ncbi:MAG: FAD-dependent oxidoreductase [Syntrophales bacterium]|nr:FAD-dependent oxidoreductase [Syntrophales bacterium]